MCCFYGITNVLYTFLFAHTPFTCIHVYSAEKQHQIRQITDRLIGVFGGREGRVWGKEEKEGGDLWEEEMGGEKNRARDPS